MLIAVACAELAGCSAAGTPISAVPSLSDVLALGSAHIAYPGSVVDYRLGSGVSTGPKGLRPAYASTVFTLRSPVGLGRFFGWWQARLSARGWRWEWAGKRPAGAQVVASHYARLGRELYEVAVDNPRLLAQAGYPVEVGRGLVYETSLIVEPASITRRR
jgi:hypothetical protein